MITATRYHDFSYGHRVAKHESKCRRLHGHNGRVHFTVAAPALDAVGRVMDFSVIKTRLCDWVESAWDHNFLVWEQDPLLDALRAVHEESIVVVPFNPTAENMARYLVDVVGPLALAGTGCTLVHCRVEETRKCAAEYARDALPEVSR